MDCQQFNQSLQKMLDGKVATLPQAAEKHKQSCESCQVLYIHMMELQATARKASQPEMSSRAETFIANRIALKITPPIRSAQTSSLWHSFLDIFTHLRWQRVFMVSSFVVAGFVLILQLLQPGRPDVNNYQAASDIDILLEEHARATDSGIFQSSYQYANIVTTTEQEQ
ncbi:MAG: hypothetical protein ACE5HI_07595 [bacterium]